MDIQLAQTEAFEEPDSSAAGFPHLEELVFDYKYEKKEAGEGTVRCHCGANCGAYIGTNGGAYYLGANDDSYSLANSFSDGLQRSQEGRGSSVRREFQCMQGAL